MERIAAVARDRYRGSMAVFGALVAAGLVAVVLGAVGAGRTDDPSIQLAYVTSGGIGGLGLIGVGLGLVAVQRRRLIEARRRAEVRRLVRATTDLLAAVGRTR